MTLQSLGATCHAATVHLAERCLGAASHEYPARPWLMRHPRERLRPSGELTLETAPVVRSDCRLTPRAPAHMCGPGAALLAAFGAFSN
jgi:hypothetical protein